MMYDLKDIVQSYDSCVMLHSEPVPCKYRIEYRHILPCCPALIYVDHVICTQQERTIASHFGIRTDVQTYTF